MKKYIQYAIYLFLCAALIFTFASCTQAGEQQPEASTEISEPITRDMRSTLLQLIEIPRGYEYKVSNEDLAAFNSLRREILSALSSMTVSQYEAYHADLTELLAKANTYQKASLPCIYLDTEGSALIDQEYVSTSVTVVDAESGSQATLTMPDATVKTRGNSSKEPNKKSYKLKFTESQELLSLGKSKTWNLISNVYDKTLLRNKLAYDLAREIGVNAPDCAFVEVYLNGEYRGNYLLTESVSSGKTKVDIDITKGDFLIELEQNPRVSSKTDKEHLFVTTQTYKTKFVVKEPEIAEMEKGRSEQISDFLNAAEKALKSGDLKQINKYFDVESFINYYIVAELFKNLDIAYSSTFFYVKDGIIYAGPAWDFDLSSGNVLETSTNVKYIAYYNRDGYGTNTGNSYESLWVAHMHHDTDAHPEHYARYEHDIEEDEIEWYSALFEIKAVRESMYARYNELQPQICNLYEDNKLGKNRMDTLIGGIYDSVQRNYSDVDPTDHSWNVSDNNARYSRTPQATYEENVEELRIWLKQRNEWLLWKFKDLN